MLVFIWTVCLKVWLVLSFFTFLITLGLIKLGNIEEFFNQNFFKKTANSRKSTTFHKDEFNGVPESHYEPNKNSPWNGKMFSTRGGILESSSPEKSSEKPVMFSTTTENFHPGSLTGFGIMENDEISTTIRSNNEGMHS